MTSALITSGQKCPLCHSSARREIDAVIQLTRAHLAEDEAETSEAPLPLGEAYSRVRRLLSEIPSDTAEFDETDFVVHASQHPLVTEVLGVNVKQEGNMLYIGDTMRQAPDLQMALMSIISTGLERYLSNPKLITPALFIKAVELAWRMNSGLAKMDEFLMALENLTRNKSLPEGSPLGAALAEHLQRTEQRKAEAAAPPTDEHSDDHPDA